VLAKAKKAAAMHEPLSYRLGDLVLDEVESLWSAGLIDVAVMVERIPPRHNARITAMQRPNDGCGQNSHQSTVLAPDFVIANCCLEA